MIPNDERPFYRKLATLAIAFSLFAVIGLPILAQDGAEATHKPADRVATTGSTLEIMTSGTSDGSMSETVTLMTATMKTSGPTDLLFDVRAECALWTDVTTIGNDMQHAIAQVEVWVEVDGERVLVSGQENPEDPGAGKVVFCNRDFKVETLQFEDEDATTERYLKSRHANAFQWTKLNLGSGEHTIEVKAQLTGEASENGFAKAAVGDRTLTVNPVKLANDATL